MSIPAAPGPSAQARAAIASWSGGCSQTAADFARRVVTSCAPSGAARARTLLWTCARLASWGETVGLGAAPTVLLTAPVIERYIAVGTSGLSPATLRTMRANLRFVARHGAPGLEAPDPPALRRDAVPRPYSEKQIEAYFELVRHQATPERVARLTGLLCLGLGAGLDSADMRHVRGNDIVCRSGGLLVVVGGAKARVVPVLVRYHDRLAISAAFAGDGFVTGGSDPERRNVTSQLTGSLDVGRLERLEVGRLRATWLAVHARRIGLPALLAAAGTRHSSLLIELAALDRVPDEEALVAVLGAAP